MLAIPMMNVLSFDVEEWFDVYHSKIKGDYKAKRVNIGIEKIVSLLRTENVKATFFILAKLAEENGEVVKIIEKAGHEIATHGYAHKLISSQNHKEFEKDLLLSIKILKNISGKEILGYRAQGYSLTKDTLWALDIIKDCGLKYDSSIYPVSLRLFTHGGIAGYPQGPFLIKGEFVEFPLPTLNLLGLKFPVATTAYFRFFPYWLTKYAITRLNNKNITPTLNFHSWEFDENHPKIKLPFPQNIKHYYNLAQTEERFKKLLGDFKFVTCQEALKNILS